MVALNVPDQDIQPANTAFWARPVREPKVDVSGETIGRTLGGAVGEGLKFADQYVREGIVAPTVQTKAGAEHDQFVDALNTAKQYIEQANQEGKPPTSLLPGKDQAGYPTQITNVGDRTDLIQKAMESGKLSETDYYARINALAKQLRSQFPGYRDEVDSQIAKVTGVHPANQMLRSQISDLNRMIAQRGEKRDEFTRIADTMAGKGLATGEEVSMWQQQYAAGKLDAAGIRSIYADREYREAQRRRNREQFEDIQHDSVLSDQFAVTSMRDYISGKIANGLENERVATGEYAGGKVSDLLKLDPTTVPSEVWTAQAAAEGAQRDAFVKEFMTEFRKPQEQFGGLSYEKMLKPDHNIQDIINKGLEAWDKRMEWTGGKDMNGRVLAGHIMQAEIADVQRLVLEDPNVRSNMALADLVKKNYGEAAWQSLLTTDSKMATMIPDQLHNLFMRDWLVGATQPRAANGGPPYELVNQLQDFKNLPGKNTDAFPQMLTKEATDRLVAKETNPALRRNTIDYLFGPHSGAIVSLVDKGGTDLYKQMFTQLTARTIAKTSPDKYDQFEHSAEMNARTLFTNSINDLKGLDPSKYNVEWHGDGIVVKPIEEKGYRAPHEYLRDAFTFKDLTGPDTAQKNFNDMIGGLKAVYDNDPQKKGTTEDFLLGRLSDMGFKPDNSIPGQLIQRLLALREPTPEEKELKAKGMPEFSK